MDSALWVLLVRLLTQECPAADAFIQGSSVLRM
jgi:hypothetical protein